MTDRVLRVVLVAAALVSAWNLLLRPYEEDVWFGGCDSPVALVLAEMDPSEARTTGARSVYSASARRERICRDSLTSWGFLVRGVAPIAVGGAAVLVIRYVRDAENRDRDH